MKTIIQALEEKIPHGKHCNPYTVEKECPYHKGMFCELLEENVGHKKQCGINEEEQP